MAKTKEPYSKKKTYLGRHCWLRDHNHWETAEVFVFLCRAPLTFGHSQLVVDVKPKLSDDEMFEKAVPYISAAIKTFESQFEKSRAQDVPTHENAIWADLARWTETSGKYLKTLILRSSADEQHKCPDTHSLLKVHLVPYFQSHEVECHKRFQDRHCTLPSQKGGLLGWLGEREDEVDRLEVDFPSKEALNKCAAEYFLLPKLANELHEGAAKELKESAGKRDGNREAPNPKAMKQTTGKKTKRRK
ncbi:MAG TPA: hypothetical protein VM243_11355 [Phycisphaerae bacterium]|nr:hypothetical protein [Phycisphaerae bacterium]